MTSLAILAAHLAADFPLQTDRMAAEKFDNHMVRLSHVAVHGITLFAAVVLATDASLETALGFASLGMLAHDQIDMRRWAEPKDGFEAYPVWVDQSLHVISLAALQVVVLGV